MLPFSQDKQEGINASLSNMWSLVLLVLIDNAEICGCDHGCFKIRLVLTCLLRFFGFQHTTSLVSSLRNFDKVPIERCALQFVFGKLFLEMPKNWLPFRKIGWVQSACTSWLMGYPHQTFDWVLGDGQIDVQLAHPKLKDLVLLVFAQRWRSDMLGGWKQEYLEQKAFNDFEREMDFAFSQSLQSR